jgi:hypothetical protein
MPGLVPGIHVLFSCSVLGVDGRVKPGHDGCVSKKIKSPARWGEPDEAFMSVRRCGIRTIRSGWMFSNAWTT